jgi:hypothetical protein
LTVYTERDFLQKRQEERSMNKKSLKGGFLLPPEELSDFSHAIIA